jgi:hypothetical protein
MFDPAAGSTQTACVELDVGCGVPGVSVSVEPEPDKTIGTSDEVQEDVEFPGHAAKRSVPVGSMARPVGAAPAASGMSEVAGSEGAPVASRAKTVTVLLP